MRLPEPPPQLGEAALRFWTQTERAIGRAFVRDDDDPSVLLALYEKMTTDAALKEIVAPLRPPVEMAIARTETLQRVAAPVRALRLAFREARATERMHVYKGVDLLRCHEALAELAQKDSTADELHIHLEKLGRVSLRAIERICTLSYRNEIQNVQFPPTRGGRKLRRLAARTYRRAFPRRHVIKTTLPEGGWTASNNVRRLRVVIGAQLPLVGVESCTMDEIILSQDTDSPERSAALKCCDVVRSTPIACDAIE